MQGNPDNLETLPGSVSLVPVAAVQVGFTVKNFDTPSNGHRYGRFVSISAEQVTTGKDRFVPSAAAWLIELLGLCRQGRNHSGADLRSHD